MMHRDPNDFVLHDPRWEMRMSINYAMLSIANIVVMLLFVCHLFACVWGLQVHDYRF